MRFMAYRASLRKNSRWIGTASAEHHRASAVRDGNKLAPMKKIPLPSRLGEFAIVKLNHRLQRFIRSRFVP